jgi:hypothetical protein
VQTMTKDFKNRSLVGIEPKNWWWINKRIKTTKTHICNELST